MLRPYSDGVRRRARHVMLWYDKGRLASGETGFADGDVMDTATRQQLAHELARHLMAQHGADLVLVGLFGSAARGDDTPWSDLDVLVVARDAAPLPPPAFVLQGIVVELHPVHEGTLLRSLRGAGPDWPYWMGIVTALKPLAGDPAHVTRWREAGLATDDQRFRLMAALDLPSLVLVPYAQIRSAAARQHTHDAHVAALRLVDDLVIALCLLNRRWLTRGGSAGLRESMGFEVQPDGYAELAPALCDAHELSSIVNLAGQLMAAYWRLLAVNDAILQNYQRIEQIPLQGRGEYGS